MYILHELRIVTTLQALAGLRLISGLCADANPVSRYLMKVSDEYVRLGGAGTGGFTTSALRVGSGLSRGMRTV